MTPPQPDDVHVVVVGSINLDHTVTVPRLPGAGETLMATQLQRTPGGKGANQAVAASRAAGAQTSMIGALGNDPAAGELRKSLTRHGVDVRGVASVDGPSGAAYITVDEHGENTITVVSGANERVAIDSDAATLIASADVLLAQLEVSQQVLVDAARHRSPGVPFVLNAAPSAHLAEDLLAQIDVLVVNEHEAVDLSDRHDLDGALEALADVVPAVVMTLGARGAQMLRRGRDAITVGSPRVDAIDAVGAGDTFCGVLAATLAAGIPDLEALQRSCTAAAIAVQRMGAQASVPTPDEVEHRWHDYYPLAAP